MKSTAKQKAAPKADETIAKDDSRAFDDAWLDEELTDEELAALGEDDFDDAQLEEELALLEAEERAQIAAPQASSSADKVIALGDGSDAVDPIDAYSEEDLDGLSDEELEALAAEADLDALDDEDVQAEAAAIPFHFDAGETAGRAPIDPSDDVDAAALLDGGDVDDDVDDEEDDEALEGLSETDIADADDFGSYAQDDDDIDETADLDDDGADSGPGYDVDDPYAYDDADAVGAAPVVSGGGAASTALVADAIVDEPFDDDDDLSADVDDGALGDVAKDQFTVPRISIHVFCETNGVTELMECAAADRRLGKAHVTMHMGGIAKAVAHFQTTPTPNLIVVETVDGGKALFGQLGELAEVCDPTTKVIIVGRINDISLYRQLVEQGVSDYVVRPKSPLQVIKSIADLYADPSAPPIGRSVAFFGARGGVGSSTIAHNIAWSAAEQHESDTVILDFDLAFGTASLDFEQDPTSGLLEALSSPERLDEVLLERLLQKYTDRLSLFTAPNLLDRDYDIDQQAFDTVIDIVRHAAPTIVIDTPHVWTGWSRRILQTADEVVITATPDLASFRNTKNLVDVIANARPNDPAPTLILNQFESKSSSVQAEQFVEHVGIEPALTIGWEPQLFQSAATNASTILEVSPKSKTAQGLNALAARLLGREESASKARKFSLAGLLGR
ncbi:MAG: AAA family ATPase [Pseudomonadota bacterium]